MHNQKPDKKDKKMSHVQRLMVLFFVIAFGLGAFGFAYWMGITPGRVYAKIQTSGPELLQELQKEAAFSLRPKEVVAEPETPDVRQLQSQSVTEFNGPLRVSSQNPRYFTDDSGNIVLLTGSHTWLNLQDGVRPDPPPEFDYDEYLAFLVEHNHNFFRLWVWEQAKWSTESADDNFFTPHPYMRTGPGNALDGKPKFNLEQFNQAYFDRMRQRIIQAGEQGIYASVMLFNGWSIEHKGSFALSQPWNGHPFNESNNINGVDGDLNNNGQGEETQTLQSATILALQEEYVRKVIDTVNDLDNVLYEISNEGPYNSEAWQYHMIQFIQDYEATKAKQHPVGMTVEYPNGSNSDLYNSPADWISPNGDINNPPVADGSKVIIADTDHLCGICGDRTWVWKSFTRGENPIFMDQYDDSYQLNGGGYDLNNPNDVSLRRNLGYALTYANRMDLALATPRGDLCSTGYCLANPAGDGRAEFLVYLPSGSSVTVNLSGVNGSVHSEWLNPESGQVSAGGDTTGGGNRQFTAPFSGDAVLYLYQADTPAPTATPTSTSQPPTMPEQRRYIPMVYRQQSSASPTPQPTPVPGGAFLETFDGDPAAPEPFQSDHWDIQVHSRDRETWYQLESMQAAHGLDCSPPPATHLVSDYEEAVYQCRNHVMTTINAGGYGLIYLTPNQLVDFSGGEAVIRFDMSTLRTSGRDWVDFWITPYEKNVALPLDIAVDLQGVPQDAVHVRMDFSTEGLFKGVIYRDFTGETLNQETLQGYESVLTPSAMVRSTFELRLSEAHLKFGLPDYGLWWIDTTFDSLGWNRGVFQIGHHSYNPTKDCPVGATCLPNTWHWDNVSINPASPFMIIKADRRYMDPAGAAAGQVVTFDQPAPANSHLRFSGIGRIDVSFDGGPFQMAQKAQTSELPGRGDYHPEHLSSYWMAIPAGIQSVRFRFGQDDWYGLEMIAKDFAIWSLGQ